MTTKSTLQFLEDRWDEAVAAKLDGPELLRYRSNLLGSDLRITNFGGGNTSSKLEQIDPLDGKKKQILWVKGSGGDLGSIKRSGFATLYMEKLLALEQAYRGVDLEDEMVDLYPLCTFGNNPVAASIDTPLHGFLPFAHVDHLHPDWGIALAASANGKIKMQEFNKEFGHNLAWLPWQRPGFELGMMLKKIVAETPGCDGVVLGGHGLFTWGDTQRESYRNTITIIDQLGQFIERHGSAAGHKHFGGGLVESRADRAEIALSILPYLRGVVSRKQRWIGSFSDLPQVLQFVNSAQAEKLAHLGTSCPDHFIRTKIRPMFIKWDPSSDPAQLKELIETALETYRAEYAEYYKKHALKDSPALRDASPTVVLVPGIGMFSFGKNKTEARITGEFYINAIGVMQGAGALGANEVCSDIPQAGPAASADQFTMYSNYVALPPSEAFRIEYWKLEEAKIRRQPPEKELSRRVALIVGGGSGIGREVVLLAAERGAHVIVADRDVQGAEAVAKEAAALWGKEFVTWTSIDIRDRKAIQSALECDHPRVWRHRYSDQHRRALSLLAGRHHQRRTVGAHARSQCHRQLSARRRDSEDLRGAGNRRQHRPHQLGERRRLQARQRSLRRQQGGPQPPRSRAGRRPVPEGPRQRHLAGHRRQRLHHVPPRPRHRLTEEVQAALR